MEAHTIDSMVVRVLIRVQLLEVELELEIPQIMRAMVLVGMDMIGHTEEVVGMRTIHTNMSLAVVEQMEGGVIRIIFPIHSMVPPCP